MLRRLLTGKVALLIVLMASIAPITVAAQGLGKPAKAFVAIGVSTSEVLELYVGPNPRTPSLPQDRVIFNYNYFVNVTPLSLPPGEESCTETLEFTVPVHRRVTVLTIRMEEGNESLFMNEQQEKFSGDCMIDAKRVFYEIGVIPRSQQDGSERIFDAEFSIQPARYYGHAVVGRNGETRAAGFTATVNHLKSKGGGSAN